MSKRTAGPGLEDRAPICSAPLDGQRRVVSVHLTAAAPEHDASADLPGLRLARGLTAQDIAALMSASRASVHRWERRERLPGPHHVRALAQALEVPTARVSGFFDQARTAAPTQEGIRGAALRGLRQTRALSGAELGDLVQVPAHTVYNWEAGRVRIPLERVRPLAAALDVDPAGFARLLRHTTAPATMRPRPLSRLAILRARKGLSQVQAAERLDVCRSSLRQWESGRQRPPLFVVRAMARLYGIGTSNVAEAAGVQFPRQLDPSTWAAGDLPEVLRVLRQWSGLTQRALGDQCGAKKDTVRAWENARAQPTPGFRQRLELIYRLPKGALLVAYRRP